MLKIHEKARYALPKKGDNNRSRWKDHPIWDLVGDVLRNKLGEYISNIDYVSTMPHFREKKKENLKKQFGAFGISRAVLDGVKVEEFESAVKRYAEELLIDIKENPYRYKEKFKKAEDRHAFIRGHNSL